MPEKRGKQKDTGSEQAYIDSMEFVNDEANPEVRRIFTITGVEDEVEKGQVVLIFFDVELRGRNESKVFAFDPPWAGKRGRG